MSIERLEKAEETLKSQIFEINERKFDYLEGQGEKKTSDL